MIPGSHRSFFQTIALIGCAAVFNVAAQGLTLDAKDYQAAKEMIPSDDALRAQIEKVRNTNKLDMDALSAAQDRAAQKMRESAATVDAQFKAQGSAASRIGIKAPTDSAMLMAPDLAELSRLIGAGAKSMAQMQKGATSGSKYETLVFISLSMPRDSLLGILRDAKRINASVVLRGLKNESLKQTYLAIQSLQKEVPGASWMIHPPAFDKYEIRRVPAWVITDPVAAYADKGDGCAPAGSYIAVVGDVSLEHALDQASRSSGRFADVAESLLAKLERGER